MCKRTWEGHALSSCWHRDAARTADASTEAKSAGSNKVGSLAEAAMTAILLRPELMVSRDFSWRMWAALCRHNFLRRALMSRARITQVPGFQLWNDRRGSYAYNKLEGDDICLPDEPVLPRMRGRERLIGKIRERLNAKRSVVVSGSDGGDCLERKIRSTTRRWSHVDREIIRVDGVAHVSTRHSRTLRY